MVYHKIGAMRRTDGTARGFVGHGQAHHTFVAWAVTYQTAYRDQVGHRQRPPPERKRGNVRSGKRQNIVVGQVKGLRESHGSAHPSTA